MRCLVVEPNKVLQNNNRKRAKNSEPLLFIASTGADGMIEQDENKIGLRQELL